MSLDLQIGYMLVIVMFILPVVGFASRSGRLGDRETRLIGVVLVALLVAGAITLYVRANILAPKTVLYVLNTTGSPALMKVGDDQDCVLPGRYQVHIYRVTVPESVELIGPAQTSRSYPIADGTWIVHHGSDPAFASATYSQSTTTHSGIVKRRSFSQDNFSAPLGPWQAKQFGERAVQRYTGFSVIRTDREGNSDEVDVPEGYLAFGSMFGCPATMTGDTGAG